MSRVLRSIAAAAMITSVAAAAAPPKPAIPPSVVDDTVKAIVAKHGEASEAAARRGVAQVAARWFAEDGDAAAFAAFCTERFAADDAARQAIFDRLETVLEQVDGRLHEIRRMVLTPQDLDTGPVSDLDLALGDLDLAAHVDDDLFKTKVAFTALLNFPVHTLSERLAQGPSWSREEWARSRMMDRFDVRLPAAVAQEAAKPFTAAEQYIANYDIHTGRLVGDDGASLGFPADQKLITHWGLRDELKSHYGEGKAGLAKQRAIQKVMERIVRQEIPEAVIGNPDVTWNPFTNAVRPAKPGSTNAVAADREPDTRYAKLLDTFRGVRLVDPYCPTAPTYIQRKFEMDRQVPEKEVEALLVSVLTSQEVKDLAVRIRKDLGRPLEPFDIWYAGFSSRAGKSEAELDAITRAKYPTVASFQAGLPAILTGLGFTPEKASWLSDRIVVDPSRGAGHAMGAERREDKAHLRTRIPDGGMLYKGGTTSPSTSSATTSSSRSRSARSITGSCTASRTTRSPRRWRSRSRRAISSCSACRAPATRSGGRTRRSGISGPLTRSAACRSSTWASGGGCTRTPTRRPRSSARRRSRSRATSGTSTTLRSSA